MGKDGLKLLTSCLKMDPHHWHFPVYGECQHISQAPWELLLHCVRSQANPHGGALLSKLDKSKFPQAFWTSSQRWNLPTFKFKTGVPVFSSKELLWILQKPYKCNVVRQETAGQGPQPLTEGSPEAPGKRGGSRCRNDRGQVHPIPRQ